MASNACFCTVCVDKCNYHINCDVIQGFPALKKAVATHVKEYLILFPTCVDIANHSVRLLNERQVDCRRFLEIWRLNTKKSVWLTDSEIQTYLEGENQCTKRKTESYVFSGFGVSISIVVFVIMIQRIFCILRVSAHAFYDCYSGIVDLFVFID